MALADHVTLFWRRRPSGVRQPARNGALVTRPSAARHHRRALAVLFLSEAVARPGGDPAHAY
jgi:hypothetical protein